ncbi:transcriptional regulator, TetR family [Rhizobiales bacterium GAS113]|nr:transcriptional regulator, TetR family [Rhizobiales bacterium GAS113]
MWLQVGHRARSAAICDPSDRSWTMSSILDRSDMRAYPDAAPDVARDEAWHALLASVASRWSEDGAERKQDRSKRREQEILRAALRVFARDGISRARIGDIAAEAGMPVSSIYEYFPSKENLAYVLPITHLSRFYREYAEAVAEKTTARERLRLYLWLAADFARRNPEWARALYLEIWPSVLVSETAVRHSIDDYVRVIIFLIRMGEANGEWPCGPDPYETAAIMNGSVNQVIITWLLYRKPRDLMKAVGSIIDRTMTLLGPVAAGRRKGARRGAHTSREK